MKKNIFLGVIFTFFFVLPSFAAVPTGLSDMELLGRHLYKDKNLSYNGTQSCQVCHHPFAGFADLHNANDPENSVVSLGADGESLGGRNAPVSAYAGFSPKLQKIDDEWVGGMFWDGRADGSSNLADPLAEQAQGPPLNPVEMNMPDKEAVVQAIQDSTYANLFNKLFGPNAFADVDTAYDNFSIAVAAYERSIEVTSFSSKFDKAPGDMTPAEKNGRILFSTHCAACHSDTADFGAPEPLFTNYQYANIGVPANPLLDFVSQDLGLGVTTNDSLQEGKFKIPTLRNIALSAPYSHNGSFATLTDMVSFINDSSAFTPDVGWNIDDSVGNLGLSDAQMADLVAFLQTLTDGY